MERGPDWRRYLLGTMGEAEEAEVERTLGSDEALAEIRAHEDALIGEYLHGVLAPEEQAAFETRFLASPERLERLVYLRARQDPTPEPGASTGRGRRSAVSWVLTAFRFRRR